MKAKLLFLVALGIITDKFDLLLKYQSATKDGAATSFFGLRAGFTF